MNICIQLAHLEIVENKAAWNETVEKIKQGEDRLVELKKEEVLVKWKMAELKFMRMKRDLLKEHDVKCDKM